MKKLLCTLVIACVIIGAAFAQQQQRPPAPAPAQPAKPATPPPAPAKPAEDSKEIKNAIGLDTFQLFKGFIATDTESNFSVFIIALDYEGRIAPHFSLGSDLDLYLMKFDSIEIVYFGLSLEGRYYPVADFDKFFLGTTIGFNSLSVDKKTKGADGGFSGLTASLKIGYKLMLGKTMHLEPSLAYVMSKSSMLSSGMASFLGVPSIPTPLGWNGGLRFGISF